MKKIDPVVIKETLYIAVWTVIFTMLTQAIFLAIGKWDMTILLGNLFGDVGAVFNFFLLGLTVQSALEKDEKDAKNQIKLSQSLRFLLIIAIVATGYLVPAFNVIAVAIPLLYVRIAIAFRPLIDRKKNNGK